MGVFADCTARAKAREAKKAQPYSWECFGSLLDAYCFVMGKGFRFDLASAETAFFRKVAALACVEFTMEPVVVEIV